MVVAIIALVAGLAGSAVALKGKNSVKSDDIARGAVKGPDIHNKAVKPPALNLFQTDGVVGPISTASPQPTDLGGPTVTVKVPRTGLIAVYARVTGQQQGGGQSAVGQVHLFEPTLLPNSPAIMAFDTAQAQTRFTVPGPGDIGGVAGPTRGGFLVFSPANPGKYTFSLRYSQQGGGAATFSNAGLWAGAVQ
ncbi:MAG: hypothetical protein ACJ75R_05385 [Solirubrobacterales bacterium]